MKNEIIITEQNIKHYHHWLDVKNRYCKCNICKMFNSMDNGWSFTKYIQTKNER